MADSRIERDCLGEMEIPNDRYYGIQTTRMLGVSGAEGLPIVFYPDIFRAMARIKKAAARANAEVGALDPEIADAIVQQTGRSTARSIKSFRLICGRAAATPASI